MPCGNVKNNSGSLEGCTLYSTQLPCSDCAKMIIQAGITTVIYGSDTRTGWRREAAKKLFAKAKIALQELEPKSEDTVLDLKSLRVSVGELMDCNQ